MKDVKQRILTFLAMVCLTLPSLAGAQAPESFDTGEDSGFYYTIQKGDTLWDLSRKFYNSQWEWPGLWEMNKEIKNPHWIYPGKKIRVYLRPAAAQTSRPVKAEPETVKTEPAPAVIPKFNYLSMNRIGFIRKKQVEVLGTIIREKDGNVMMSSNDIIYIKPASPDSFVPGERYQIFTTEKLKEKIQGETYRGIKHLIKADLEIIETQNKYAIGKITDSFRDATVGDKIMAYYHRATELTVEEHPPPIDAVLLCSEDNTLMINDYSIAFINKGSDHRVAPGHIYSVMQSQGERSAFDGEDSIGLSPLFSGKLIVLQTEPISSTVIILSSKRDIHPGDMVN